LSLEKKGGRFSLSYKEKGEISDLAAHSITGKRKRHAALGCDDHAEKGGGPFLPSLLCRKKGMVVTPFSMLARISFRRREG